MTRHNALLSSVALAAVVAVAPTYVGASGHAGKNFNRIASFPVNLNIPADIDQATESSAEIIDATEDGMMLVYSDSPLGGIGKIDISNPNEPKPAGFISTDGEPTAVSVQSGRALVAINTSENFVSPSGKLLSINLSSGETEQTCDLGGQPDSIAISLDGRLSPKSLYATSCQTLVRPMGTSSTKSKASPLMRQATHLP